jgi:putative ABC transport system ATP-binding protein
MIRLEKINRIYATGASAVHAVRDCDLEIRQGDYLSIMGPSGSGKSSLLNILGCLDRPTSGTYRFEDRDVGALPDRELSLLRRNRIGFIFQFFHLVPRLTAAGNIELPMIFAGLDPARRRERIARALEQVGLTARGTHRPEELSGGERQRVAIARAIAMEPALLLADEPTGNLDSVTGKEIMTLLEEMNGRGLTLIVVTHDATLGDRARRRIRIADGVARED